MALDGIFLHLLSREILDTAFDARVEKIYQPARDEIVLALRTRSFAGKLLISANPGMPRLHFTEHSPENPSVPPMLCMLLRKHLQGARFAGIEQQGLERAICLLFDGVNELGDKTRYKLMIEIMARHSNIILLDEHDTIIDSVRRVDAEMSSVRQILPGMTYQMPPAQPKLDLTSCTAQDIVDAVTEGKNELLSKKLLSIMQGCSPIVCRELSYLACRGNDMPVNELNRDSLDRLRFYILRIVEIINSGKALPHMVIRADTNKPADFSFINITQYGNAAIIKQCDSLCCLLDDFYYQRDRAERIRRRSQDLLKVLTNAHERASRKINAQKAELSRCADREQLRICGDLITANLYKLEKGMTFAQLENYYEPECPVINVKLDPAKTPAQNAQKYYKDYRKAQTAEEILKQQIKAAQEEIIYIDTVFDCLSRADTERELIEIRQELSEQGYIKLHTKGRQKASAPMQPLKFTTDEGFEVLVGRNNVQNDRLTLKTAHNGDIWLHTKNIPGAHTVICSRGSAVSDETLMQAAAIAAYHSSARDSSQVPVDYTLIKSVKKPNGAKPGMVIYDSNKTIYVTPDEGLIERLRIK